MATTKKDKDKDKDKKFKTTCAGDFKLCDETETVRLIGERCAELEQANRTLKKQVSGLRGEITKLNGVIKRQKDEIDRLQSDNDTKAFDLAEYRRKCEQQRQMPWYRKIFARGCHD